MKEKKKKKRKKKINKKNKNNMYKFDMISVGPLEFYAPCLFNFMLPLQINFTSSFCFILRTGT